MIFGKKKKGYTFLPEHTWDFDGIPKAERAGISSAKWVKPDTLELFQTNNPIGWTEDSIDYNFNSLGYRSIEFEDTGAFKVASFGCSFTFGIGIKQEDTWPEVFCRSLESYKKTPVVNFNFGLPATSADFVARMVYNSIKVVNPDLILALLPAYERSEYFEADGSMRKRYPNNKLDKNYYEHFGNHYEFKNNYMKNYYFLKTFLSLNNIPWIFTTYETKMVPYLNNEINYAGNYEHVMNDFARDMSHPGPLTNRKLSNLFFEKYIGKKNDR